MTNNDTNKLLEVIEAPRSGFWGKEFQTEENILKVRVITNGDAQHFDKIRPETLPIRWFTQSEYNRAKLLPGDIIITTSGEPGSVAQYVESRTDVVVSNFVKLIRVKKAVDSQFLFYTLRSNFVKRQTNPFVQHSVIANLNPDFFKQLLIPSRRLEEQQKIAEILTTIDEAIEKTDAIIEKQRRVKQGLMQDLFYYGIDEKGKIRTESTHRFKDSQIGRIPEDWVLAELGSYITKLTDYHANGSYERLKDNVTLLHQKDYAIMIRTTNLENGEYMDLIYVDRKAYKFLKASVVKPQDILMNKIANAGSTYIMPDLKYPITLGMNLFLIRTNQDLIDHKFAFEYLKFKESYVKSFAKGTTTKTITKDAVRKLLIIKPGPKEQSRITSVLSAINDVVEKEKIYKEKLTLLKRGLMEDLLTGAIPVNHLIN